MTTTDSKALFEGLQALADSAFPKSCATCGRTYQTPNDFLLETDTVAGNKSGLRQTRDFDGSFIVEVFRNCVCGSTLMDEFSNRRDDSKAGLERRQNFERVLKKLMEAGLEREPARAEIFKFMAGETSDIIANLLSESS